VRRLAACLAAIFTLGLAAPGAALACNGWSERDMQTQLMCITCRVPIDQSESLFADHVRSFVHQKCAAGWTSSQVKDTLVARFGEEILAAPPKHGFTLLAWVVPGAVLLAGIGVAVTLAMRWSRSRRGPPRPPPGGGTPSEDVDADLSARIDADLARFE
jgi:cytochrome c-type biogenesis protein CcmH